MNLSSFFKRKAPTTSEITQYTNDLETISIMRDKAEKNGHFDEAAQHSETIEVMQLVLQFLLEQQPKSQTNESKQTNSQGTPSR